MKIAGVVILYHPDNDVIENINSYISDIDYLYIIDNTERRDDSNSINLNLLHSQKFKYVKFNENKGIAYALNFVLANIKEFDMLLTMDQDSKFPPLMLEKYKYEVSLFNDCNVIMFTLNYNGDGNKIKKASRLFSEVEKTITSGSILLVEAAKKVGGFDEKLFIDEVDHEFCFRSREKGYRIIKCNNVYLSHRLGTPIYNKMLGFGSTNHSPVRKYYIVRNKIYVMKKYPAIRKEYLVFFVKAFISMIILEKNKMKKIKYILLGVKDAFCNKMGKNNTKESG